MSNKAKKVKNPRPNEKPSRSEVQAAFQAVSNDIQQLRLITSFAFDLVVEKGVFTNEELAAFLTKKVAALQAAQNPQEAQCPPDISSQPSSTPTIS